jgi:hypothetical protein
MNSAQRWREEAEAIREKARPLSARVDALKEKLKLASEFQSEGLLIELSQLTKQIGAMAREANFCDERARGDIGGVR